MGFVHGAMWGRVQGRKAARGDSEDQFPHDWDILRRVLRGALSNADLYPVLAKSEIEGFPVYPTEEEWAALRRVLGIDSPSVSTQEEKEGETDG